MCSAGTITTVSIGNSGSGYRSGVQGTVNVGVQTYNTGIASAVPIGTATISEGHITAVAITSDPKFYIPRSISGVAYSSVSESIGKSVQTKVNGGVMLLPHNTVSESYEQTYCLWFKKFKRH